MTWASQFMSGQTSPCLFRTACKTSYSISGIGTTRMPAFVLGDFTDAWFLNIVLALETVMVRASRSISVHSRANTLLSFPDFVTYHWQTYTNIVYKIRFFHWQPEKLCYALRIVDKAIHSWGSEDAGDGNSVDSILYGYVHANDADRKLPDHAFVCLKTSR